MGRPKGSTTKRTQTVQQDIQQAALIATKQNLPMRDSGDDATHRTETLSHPILETQKGHDILPTQENAIRILDKALGNDERDFSIISSKQAYDLIVALNKEYEQRKSAGKLQPQPLPQTGKAQGAVSKQTTSQAVASLWAKNTDDFPEDLNSLSKIDARKILGVPFICVGIEEKVGGPDSLNPGKPFWTMQLLFDGTGDEEFSCNVSGGYLANQIKRISQFVSYEHPLYRTFELVPEYITATDKIQNKQYPPYWLKQWRSVRGEYNVTFAY